MANLKKIVAKATKPKAQKPRAKKTLASILGSEPKLISPSNVQMAVALNWYESNATDRDQRVVWVMSYMQAENYSADQISEFKKRGKKFLRTYSALARMLMNGCILEDHHKQLLDEQIRKFVSNNQSDEFDDVGENEEGETAATVKVQKKDRSKQVAAEFVQLIDDNMDRVLAGEKVEQMYATFVAKSMSVNVAKLLRSYYKPQADEFRELARGVCDQLDEGYSHLKKPLRRAINEWMQNLIADLDSVINNKKQVRKQRAKKAPKVENVVKRVKYKKDSTEYKLVSINPTEVVGKKTLWIFNTRYKQIGCYTATDDAGFTFKGTTLINAEGTAKVLRKPEEFLAEFRGTPKALETKFKNVKTKAQKLNGRINENTILLKAI